MADKILNTRLRLKYDTLANWSAANPVLLKGEVGIVSVPLASETTVGQVVKPAILFKVGDGTTDFNTLPFASGMAADVHAWAKEATGRAEDIQVFDESNAFIGKTVTEALAQLNTEIGALTGGGESGSISQMINEAINALDVADSAEEGKYVSAITQEDGKIKVVRASLPDYSNVYASKSIENDVATIKSDYLKTADKTELTTAINSKTTLDEVASQGYAKTTDVNAALQNKVDKIDGYSLVSDAEIARLASVNNYNDTEVRGLISDNADAIAAIKEGATASTLKELEDSIAGVKATADAAATKTALDGEITRAKAAEGQNASDIALVKTDVEILVGSDNNKSVRTIANEELAAQLIAEGAAESLDTLQEIAAWIQSHPGNASAMNSAIQALQAKTVLGTNGEGTEYATVKAYVEAAIAALNIGDYAKAAALTALADRVTVNETAITNITKEDGLIATAKAEAAADAATKAGTAESNAKAYTDTEIGKVNVEVAKKANDADLAAIAKTGNVNDLVQTEGDVLVLFGGNAAGWTE